MLSDEGVFYGVTQVGGVNVVSKVQSYIDFFNYPARGEEAAEMVLRALEKEWVPREANYSSKRVSPGFK